MIDTILIFFHKIFPNPSKSRAKKPINTANKNANIPPMIFSFSYVEYSNNEEKLKKMKGFLNKYPLFMQK